ncbi:MAG: tetratricopeptide repeat protein [Gammaproteobacteria bacterium]
MLAAASLRRLPWHSIMRRCSQFRCRGDGLKAGVFFGELKRRNVLRAGAFYAAAVWALSQGIAQLAPYVGAPDWVVRWFLVACVIGFPFWLAFAWVYEITPSGLKRESEIAPGDSIAHSTGRKLDFWIIGIMAVAIVLLVTNQFVLHRDATSTTNVANAKAFVAALAKVPAKSVAVLPLANESGNAKQQYFVDGMSEELITDLSQINGLKVIGKYSSFKFRDSKDSPAQIGATLGVAHLIQGSVFQAGESIRVTVSMIRAKDGGIVWSHSYDEPLKDVFAIQAHIGQAVAAALKVKLLGQTLGINDKPPSGKVEAYQLMLQGRALGRHVTEADLRQGIALSQQALKLDPDYAYAWGTLSNAWLNLGVTSLTGDAQQRAFAQARVAAEKQQLLAPDAPATHMTRGYLLAQVDNDPKGALAEYQRANALAPHDGNVMNFLAGGYLNLGQLQPAAELYRKAIVTDPLRPDFYANLAGVLLAQGQLDAAEQAIRKALALQPDYPLLYANLAAIDILRGDAAAAVRDAKQETDPVVGPAIRAMAQQINPDHEQADVALHAYIAKYGKDQPYFVADLYALRKQPDDMFAWLQRAWTQHDPQFTAMLYDPFALAWQHDPRFAALCKQAGLPLPGRPPPAAAVASGQ